jgi:hypothetical protein
MLIRLFFNEMIDFLYSNNLSNKSAAAFICPTFTVDNNKTPIIFYCSCVFRTCPGSAHAARTGSARREGAETAQQKSVLAYWQFSDTDFGIFNNNDRPFHKFSFDS